MQEFQFIVALKHNLFSITDVFDVCRKRRTSGSMAGCTRLSESERYHNLSATRIWALTRSIHNGNSSAIHNELEMTTNITAPNANPESATHRLKIPVRKAI